METFEITRATVKDAEIVQKIAAATFLETYSAVNSEKNMQDYLASHYTLDQFITELNHPFSEFYLAVLNQKIIGFLKINFGEAQTELQDKTALEIERIYVLSDFHGKKIGQLLFNKAIEIAKKDNLSYLWLGVWEKNPKAIRFYEKNGLTVFNKHLFQLGDEEQTDLMMKIELH